VLFARVLARVRVRACLLACVRACLLACLRARRVGIFSKRCVAEVQCTTSPTMRSLGLLSSTRPRSVVGVAKTVRILNGRCPGE
jgi:hypothetical protein